MSYRAFGKLQSEGWADRSTVGNSAASFARATDVAIAPIVNASGAGPGTRVLNLCCGHGGGTEALLVIGAEVAGLDFSPAMLRQARGRAQAADLREGDAQSMSFSDATFDAVVCGFGIMHVPDQPKALSEVHRVLRPGTARRGKAMLLAVLMKLWDDRSQLPGPEKRADDRRNTAFRQRCGAT